MNISKIALAVALVGAAQAASASIVVTIDNFDNVADSFLSNTSAGGVFTSTGTVHGNNFFVSTNPSGSNPASGNGVYRVNLDASAVGTGLLSYATGVDLSNGATASLSYSVVFSNTGTPETNNQITFGGAATGQNDFGKGSTATFTSLSYAGGAFSLAFSSVLASSAWDYSIDNLQATVNCGNQTGSYASVAAYNADVRSGKLSCSVPVPGSLALLGLGGIAAGLVSRRRAAK